LLIGNRQLGGVVDVNAETDSGTNQLRDWQM
jgi:hypothetical protein